MNSDTESKHQPKEVLHWLLLGMLIFVPLALAGQLLHWPAPTVFFLACLAVIPLAGLMGKATESLADRMGPGPGGLLNATFGNACELIIAITALKAGLIEVVKASIIGSILGNILLVLGASMLAGGLRYKNQYFNRTAATTSATLLALAAITLIVPTVFHHARLSTIAGHPAKAAGFQAFTLQQEQELAMVIAVIQMLVYLLSLIFSLATHKNLYVREMSEEVEEALGTSGWSIGRSIAILATATVFVAVISECLVHSVEGTANRIGLSHTFIGVILLAIIGNAAEHSTAVLMAMKNKMDLAVNIALGSSTQIALFVAPIIVFAGALIGRPMDLSFSLFETVSITLSVIILAFVTLDGECNWLEGVQLLAVYSVIATAFYFL